MIGDDRQDGGKGVRLRETIPNGPAFEGGLQKDDLITSVNGQPIHSLAEMASLMQPLQAGSHVVFEAQRGGTTRTFDIILGRRPSPAERRFQNFGRLPDAPSGQATAGQPPQGGAPAPSGITAQRLPTSGERPLLGVRTLPVSDQDRVRLRLPDGNGAHVVGRSLGSPAERANIPLDAVITAVNGQSVTSPQDLTALLAQAGIGQNVEVTYFYNGTSASANATLAAMTGSIPLAQSPPIAPRGLAGPSSPESISAPGEMPMPSNSLPSRSFSQPSQGDAQRIEELERRVRELEQKFQDLEGRPQRGA
jgi:hypothetical protein